MRGFGIRKKKSYKYCNFRRGQKKLRVRLLFLFLMCAALCLEIAFLTGKDGAGREETKTAEEELVLTAELAGYLQIFSFSPEETRAWILPETGKYLTGKDVDDILDFLDIASFAEVLQEKITYGEDEEISRLKWCLIYEELTEYLGLADDMQVVAIQYFGMLSKEGRLMADNGDYDCDPDSLYFTYGEKYNVYICGNTVLGKQADAEISLNEPGEGGQEDFSGASSAEISVPETIRVVLTQDNNASAYRESVRLKGSAALHITGGNENEYTCDTDAKTAVNCTDLMEEWNVEELTVETEGDGKICVANSEGSAVSSWYRGVFYLYKNEKGVWIVNEVCMEDYLCGVVPGEMPESFAEEALKAQAICARTYACCLAAKERYAEYSADLTDTTDCQVYLPSKENEKASQAVEDTGGYVLTYGDYLANIYYFSSSCGYTSGTDVWQMKEVAYLPGISLLTGKDKDAELGFDEFLRDTEITAYDSESRYFRWQSEVDMAGEQESVKEFVGAELEKGSGKVSAAGLDGEERSNLDNLGDYVSMSVTERNSSGIVTDLRIEFANGYIDILHENMIRTVLGLAMNSFTDKNGDSVYTLDMLPSAAISLECLEDGTYLIYGGGLGHGIGMSQYGANGMADAGMDCMEILEMFFPGTEAVCAGA